MRPPSRQCLFASRWSAGVMGRLVCSGRTAGLGRTGRASRVHARVLFTKAHKGGCTSVRALHIVLYLLYCIASQSIASYCIASYIALLHIALLHIVLSHECGGTRNYVGHYHIT